MNISKIAIGCALTVHRELGNGYLESVYERAMGIELAAAGVKFERQVSLPVTYRGNPVGIFVADILIEDTLIIELKASSSLNATDEAQVINYLKASNLPVGLLLNFGKKSLQTKRLVHRYNEATPI